MSYTQQVLEETLRLYPPVWLFTRRSHEEDQLDDYDVPPGTDIYLSPFLLHRTERYWPEPSAFDPDRFAQADKADKDRPYFPFSLGPRRCLGEYFSFLEMKVHLGLLLPRFRHAARWTTRSRRSSSASTCAPRTIFICNPRYARQLMELYDTLTELLRRRPRQGRGRSGLSTAKTTRASSSFAGPLEPGAGVARLAAGARHADRATSSSFSPSRTRASSSLSGPRCLAASCRCRWPSASATSIG